MGWFDKQIRQRKLNDEELFASSLVKVANTVMGAKLSAACGSKIQISRDAIEEILRYYKIKIRELPTGMSDVNDQLEYLMRPSGIMRRTVELEKGWYKDAIGPMLGVRKADQSLVALLPGKLAGYVFTDMETGKTVSLSAESEQLFETEAIAFYRPFPLKKLDLKDLTAYILGALSPSDYAAYGLCALAVSLVGLISPALNRVIFSSLIGTGSIQMWFSMLVFLVCAAVSTFLLGAAKSLYMARISTKVDVPVYAATMMRILSLPADFFKNYSAGDLAARAQYLKSLCNDLASSVFSLGLSSLFSLIYVAQIFTFAPALVVPALCIILATLLLSVVSTLAQVDRTRRQLEAQAKESGLCYSLISGIQKIKLAGAEKRAFSKWGELYARVSDLTYNKPFFLKSNSAIALAISLVGTIVLYYEAVSSGVSVADYYAFNTSYAMVSGAFMSLTGVTALISQLKPVMDMIKPLMDAVPEQSENRQVVTRIQGGIEINHVTFKYGENLPIIIDDLSLKIRPGEYVAIVGSTGCGKSTLMRMLMGFETPQKGAIYYDGKDMSTLDLKSLRRKIGVVLQNGKLFQGDIFSNITISAPWLTLDEAWQAAEMSGIADDIRAMPMGMNTIISEGSGGISGGQRQRLMIARAIAPKPRVLMFDEATSALDNITQKQVSDALDKLKCTRIVIAHRLSTIRQCDRIIVLDKGKIAEEGTYDELIAREGFFAGLVERQRLDKSGVSA